MAESCRNGQKIQLEMEKFLVTCCGKWRNFLLQAISPFPTVFSKDLYCRHVKTKLVWESINEISDDFEFGSPGVINYVTG